MSSPKRTLPPTLLDASTFINRIKPRPPSGRTLKLLHIILRVVSKCGLLLIRIRLTWPHITLSRWIVLTLLYVFGNLDSTFKEIFTWFCVCGPFLKTITSIHTHTTLHVVHSSPTKLYRPGFCADINFYNGPVNVWTSFSGTLGFLRYWTFSVYVW